MNKSHGLQLRCYCCGEPIGRRVTLVTPSEGEVDRVFVMNPDHAHRAEGNSELVIRSTDKPGRRAYSAPHEQRKTNRHRD